MVHICLVLLLAAMPGAAALGATPAAPLARSSAAALPVNINTASAEQLDALPGIGPAMAERILQARRLGGPFQGPADVVQRVKGLGEKRLRRLVAAGLTLGEPGPSIGSPRAEPVPSITSPRAEPYTFEHAPHNPRPRTARPPR